ncbi:hypothetical protein GCM10010399_14420 [Dactylosporangium fulvum]
MPGVRIEMFSGRTMTQKRELVRRVTDAVVDALGVDKEGVRVKIIEEERHHVAHGGVLSSELP